MVQEHDVICSILIARHRVFRAPLIECLEDLCGLRPGPTGCGTSAEPVGEAPASGHFPRLVNAETYPHDPPFLAIKLRDPLQTGFSMMDAIGMLSASD